MKHAHTCASAALRSAFLVNALVAGGTAHPQGPSQGDIQINEIYVNQHGLDTLEFIELRGPAGASLLDHMVLVVDGDGLNAGTLDRAFDLSSHSLSGAGFFVLGDSGVAGRDVDLGHHDGLENGSCTIYLVTTTMPSVVSGLVGRRIALGQGTTSIPSLCTIRDSVGLFDSSRRFGESTEPPVDSVFDGAPAIGPDGDHLPAGIFRCGVGPHGWSASFLDHDPDGTSSPDTPGADNTATCVPGTSACPGDGSGAPCPCSNPGTTGRGCANSVQAAGALLAATGAASIGDDSVALLGSGMPDSSALYFQGTSQSGGGLGVAFGDGLRCAAGSVIRLGTKTNSGGASQYPAGGDPSVSVRGLVSSPGTRTYQVWYRNAAAFCTPSTFNLSNGVLVTWET
jgi:hypothetical protein